MSPSNTRAEHDAQQDESLLLPARPRWQSLSRDSLPPRNSIRWTGRSEVRLSIHSLPRTSLSPYSTPPMGNDDGAPRLRSRRRLRADGLSFTPQLGDIDDRVEVWPRRRRLATPIGG